MTPPISMIRAQASDVDAYVAFRRRMLEVAPWAFAATVEDDVAVRPDFVRERLTDPENGLFLARAGEGIVGAVGIYRQASPKFAHRASLWGLFVEETHRGHGVGRALIVAALALARQWKGLEYVDLGVSEAAPEAQHLYESVGFVAWGREPGATALDGRRLDEIHMAYRVTPPVTAG